VACRILKILLGAANNIRCGRQAASNIYYSLGTTGLHQIPATPHMLRNGLCQAPCGRPAGVFMSFFLVMAEDGMRAGKQKEILNTQFTFEILNKNPYHVDLNNGEGEGVF
jgi:hypothetical protein